MKHLFIHIGTHKTGTTTFQHTLKKHTPGLVKYDGLLPVWMSKFPEYKKLASTKTYNPRLAEECRDFIEDKTKNGNSFIISAEGLSGNIRDVVYLNTGIVARTLLEATSEMDAQIIVVLRRQDEILQSLFTQKKHKGERIALTEFMSNVELDYLNWNNFLKPWTECFGDNNVHVLPYDRSVFSRYSVVSLLNTVIRSTVLEKLENNDIISKNVGYSPAASTIAESINPKLSASQRKILRRVLQEVGNKGVLEEYNILPKDEKIKLVDHFYESNAVLAKKYFLQPFGMSNFSDPVFAQNNQGTKEEVLMRTIVELINTLEAEQQKTRQFPINFILRAYRRIRGFKTSLQL